MRCGLYREVTQKSQNAIEVSTLMGCRKLLVEQKVQATNAVRGFLKTYGIRLGPTTDGNFVKKAREVLPEKHQIAKLGIDGVLNHLETLYENIKMLTKTVENLAREDKDVQRLTTIPGVGTITAMTFKAEIDDPKRFKNSRAVGAYLGMTPRQYSSGETKRLGRISKCGSPEVRTLLNEAALVLLTRSKKWSKLRAWGLKIQRKHGFKKACMAVGRKLATIMHRMWLDKTDFVYGEPKDAKAVCPEEISQDALHPIAESAKGNRQCFEEAPQGVCVA
jgi:transposase